MAGALGAIGGGSAAGAGAAGAGSAAGGSSMMGSLGGALGGLMGMSGKGSGSGGGNSPFYDMGGLMRDGAQKGSEGMMAAASGRTPIQPTAGTKQGPSLTDLLIEQLQNKNSQATPQSSNEPSLQLQNNPMNPLNKPQLNLGNQASQLDSLKNFKYPL